MSVFTLAKNKVGSFNITLYITLILVRIAQHAHHTDYEDLHCHIVNVTMWYCMCDTVMFISLL